MYLAYLRPIVTYTREKGGIASYLQEEGADKNLWTREKRIYWEL